MITFTSAPSDQNSRIQTLSVHLANQIAAGEVIERPASVVKELVENSLDAGATQIDIVTEQGGSLLIKVADNGRGIHKDDLTIALAPHATSKIRQSSDLEEILTLGFRGEALASISSVARVKLQSRQPDTSNGWAIDSRVDTPYPAAMAEGTQIEVRELFYNTPARKRFLRTDRTEYLQVEEVVRRLALSHFECGFSFKNNTRQIFKLTPAHTQEKQGARVRHFYGKHFIENSQMIEYQAEGLALHGWIGNASFSLSQSDRQYVYLNGRMVKDRLITHALRQAYNDLIEPGRSPAFLIYLSVDPVLVDVNVHPTKHEVRFRDARRIHDFLFASLHAALTDSNETMQTTEPAAVSVPVEYPQQRASSEIRHYLAEKHGDYQRHRYPSPPQLRSDQTEKVFNLGQRFLVIPYQQQLLLLDYLSIHHDYLYSHLSKAEALVLQPLLFPLITTSTETENENFNNNLKILAQWGISLERSGDQITLKQMPALLRGIDPQVFMQALQCETEHFIKAVVELSRVDTPPYNQQTLQHYLQQHDIDHIGKAISTGYGKYLTDETVAGLFSDE